MSKSKRTARSAGYSSDWNGYVNFHPTETDKQEVLRLLGSSAWSPFDALGDLVADGYSVSFAWDDKSSCFRLAVTGKGDGNPNKGYTLSLRHTDPEKLLGMAFHYVRTVCDGGRWQVDGGDVYDW